MTTSVFDIFTPTDIPKHTYVARESAELERQFKQALRTPGQLISISGPSKSGKTVLVRKIIGDDYLIRISGASIHAAGELWNLVLDWIGEPHTSVATNAEQASSSSSNMGKVGLRAVASVETSTGNTSGAASTRSTSMTAHRRGMNQVASEIANSDWVVFVDDFHYMSRGVQQSLAQQLKAASELGIKICTASVPHRADDVVRALPELRGRLASINVDYWSGSDLQEIAQLGFSVLNASLVPDSTTAFISESAGSPQLMQSICLQAALFAELESPSTEPQELSFTPENREKILVRVSQTTDFRSLLHVLSAGPKTRGKERVQHLLRRGGSADVYGCVLHALAADPPQLSYTYETLNSRVRAVCSDSKSGPGGSSVASTCNHLANLASTQMPKERALDWDIETQNFDITDPYLLFFLRWSRDSPARKTKTS